MSSCFFHFIEAIITALNTVTSQLRTRALSRKLTVILIQLGYFVAHNSNTAKVKLDKNFLEIFANIF